MHTRGKPLAKEIDLDNLAGQTPGFTGADLANLVNEAALLAAREGKREITQHELEEGIMRVIAGPEKKTRVMGEKERLVTAYHEMGHAMVAHFLEHTDPVHKISIISRGQALGYTISLPTEDKFLTTRAELADTLAMTLGGRAAEEIAFSEITTGAANDLEKVTATAKQMVMRFGMSEKLGPRTFGHDQSHAVPRPRVQRRARLLGRDRARDRRRDPPDRRGGAPDRAPGPDATAARTSTASRSCCSSTRRSSARSSRRCSPASPQEEVFGAPEPSSEPPAPPVEARARRPVAEPRPLPHPRPGYAAEMRGDGPEAPSLSRQSAVAVGSRSFRASGRHGRPQRDA